MFPIFPIRNPEKLHEEIGLKFKRDEESAVYFGFCTIRNVAPDGTTLVLAWDRSPYGWFSRAIDSPLIHPCDWHQQMIKQNRKRKKLISPNHTTRIMFHTHGMLYEPC